MTKKRKYREQAEGRLSFVHLGSLSSAVREPISDNSTSPLPMGSSGPIKSSPFCYKLVQGGVPGCFTAEGSSPEMISLGSRKIIFSNSSRVCHVRLSMQIVFGMKANDKWR